MKPRALIVGGSVGGLIAAQLLRGIGWEVSVFERVAEDLAGRGAGIGTRPELFAVLRNCGIRMDETMGVEVRSRKFFDLEGRLVQELPIPSVNSAWDRVYRPLKEALPRECFHAGAVVEGVEQRGSRVTALLAGGARAEGELLVGADGLHSTVRSQHMPEAQPRYSGYFAWRGVLEEGDLRGEAHAALFHHMSFCLPEGELMLSLPMAGRGDDTRPGHRRYHFIWFRPAGLDSELRELCTDASGQTHAPSIPPPLIRKEVLAALRSDAALRLPPLIAALVDRAPLPILQPIYDLESPQLVFGRVALLGDAAFVARPHVATGITKAALDAQCLADSLAADGIDAGLARYEKERRQAGSALVARARRLGCYLEPGPKSAEAQREAEFHRRPEVLLREYGAAGAMLDGAGAVLEEEH